MVLKMDQPNGRRVRKLDGPFGPKGAGGGFATDSKKWGGKADAAGCVEGLCIASAQGAAAPAALRVMVSPCGVQQTHFALCELDL